jgi:hypothetical protein
MISAKGCLSVSSHASDHLSYNMWISQGYYLLDSRIMRGMMYVSNIQIYKITINGKL